METIMGDLPLITEESFDFDPYYSPDSDDEDEANPVLHWSPLSAQGMAEITKEANRLAKELKKENIYNQGQHSLLSLGIASIEKQTENNSSWKNQVNFVTVSSGYPTGTFSSMTANTYASENQQENTFYCGQQSYSCNLQNMLEGTATHTSSDICLPVCITSPGHQSLLLSNGTTSLRSPRRETYVIKDSPNRSFLPDVSIPPIYEQSSIISHEKREGNGTSEKYKKYKFPIVRTCSTNGSPRGHNSEGFRSMRSQIGMVKSCSTKGSPRGHNSEAFRSTRSPTGMVRSCSTKGNLRGNNPEDVCNARSPTGNSSAGKPKVHHVHAAYLSSGVPTFNSRLPVPKSLGTHSLGNTRHIEQKVCMRLIRPSTQRETAFQFSVLKPAR
ncbi:uncharacterized protein LOC134607104 [Pelobates fuscus]|uniref:uncharacterized protein LOC134607104 n=1 Tax=Pelobates fuscus TaxID=191477 RepID=UPI002FE4EC8D